GSRSPVASRGADGLGSCSSWSGRSCGSGSRSSGTGRSVRGPPSCNPSPNDDQMWRPSPETVSLLAERWSLTIGTPFAGPEVSAAWVAPVLRAGGSQAVLKLGMPHMEARDEIAGLRYWDGDGTVRLLDADEELNAMLLE